MAQINVDGGDGGDAPHEHPESECVSRESSEEEERVGEGKEVEGYSSGAEGEITGRGGRVMW